MTALVEALIGALVTAGVITWSGTLLARSGDAIAARTRLGGLWVGSVFLAFATSLPELLTDVAAVRLGAFDLAAGDLFGSSMANMMILAALSLLPGGIGIFRKAAVDHVLYGVVAIVLTCVAAVFILLPDDAPRIAADSVMIVGVYLIGSRLIFRHSALARQATATEELSEPRPAVATPVHLGDQEGLRRPIATFVFAAAIIVVVAPRFAVYAERLATLSGIGETFVGTTLVGISTSLPELVTSIAAVRMGAFDLAVGNLFGSNAFNMSMFAVLDVVQGPGSFFSVLSQAHVISATVAVALMAIALAGLVYRSERRYGPVEPVTGAILAGYLLGLIALSSA